jgi:hypothetical protein
LIRPAGVAIDIDFVLVGLAGFDDGSTIRCVDRVEAVAARVGLVGAVPGRGIIIGCVVATPEGIPGDGISPDGAAGFPGEAGPVPGGV